MCHNQSNHNGQSEQIEISQGANESFASDWLIKWREFSTPITTERGKIKPMQSRITFDNQLKIALMNSVVCLANIATLTT